MEGIQSAALDYESESEILEEPMVEDTGAETPEQTTQDSNNMANTGNSDLNKTQSATDHSMDASESSLVTDQFNGADTDMLDEAGEISEILIQESNNYTSNTAVTIESLQSTTVLNNTETEELAQSVALETQTAMPKQLIQEGKKPEASYMQQQSSAHLAAVEADDYDVIMETESKSIDPHNEAKFDVGIQSANSTKPVVSTEEFYTASKAREPSSNNYLQAESDMENQKLNSLEDPQFANRIEEEPVDNLEPTIVEQNVQGLNPGFMPSENISTALHQHESSSAGLRAISSSSVDSRMRHSHLSHQSRLSPRPMADFEFSGPRYMQPTIASLNKRVFSTHSEI